MTIETLRHLTGGRLNDEELNDLKGYVEARITEVREEATALGAIQGSEFANNLLYDNCPTGDVNAWDMLKGVQKTQEGLSAFVDEMKKYLPQERKNV